MKHSPFLLVRPAAPVCAPFLTVHVPHRPGKCKEVKNRSTSGSCGEAEQAFPIAGEIWS